MSEIEEIAGRIPPHDIEAEKAVLSAILLDNDAIHAVVTEVREEDFYHPAHQILYRSMVRLRGLARARGFRDDVDVVEGGTTTLAPRLPAAS